MFDARARTWLAPLLDRGAGVLDRRGIGPLSLTGAGVVVGAGACVAAAIGAWGVALVLWLTNRLADGLDGPLARRRGVTELGGVLDIVADFAVYGGFVVGVAIGVPDARLAAAATLAAYYVSGATFLAWSTAAERLRRERPDERSLHFVGGLAEGTETIVVYVAICLIPSRAETILWLFAALVAVTAGQRLVFVARSLRPHVAPSGGRSGGAGPAGDG